MATTLADTDPTKRRAPQSPEDPTSLLPEEAGARAAAVRSGDRAARHYAILRQTESDYAAEESGDVRGGSRRCARHRLPDPRHLRRRRQTLGFELQIALWLWFTVLFANFAEAMAEARGKAQADTLRKTKTDAMAKRLPATEKSKQVPASKLRAGDIVICEAGELIPGDGEVIEGIATVDESVITGESAPVIRESGGDRSAVTGGTKVLSDQIKIRITSNPGETFLDNMIALVEGAERQKTPNEIALNILIAGLTLIFLLAVATLHPYSPFMRFRLQVRASYPTIAVLVSLLVCLIPTTIGGLLSAIGIAGMDRVMQHNVLAMSGKAVEASGDVNTLLLDKTGTITLGNRQAVEFIPLPGVSERGTGGRRTTVESCGRNSGGPFDRRAGKREVWPARARSRGTRSALHSFLGLYPNERRRYRRRHASKRSKQRDCEVRDRVWRRLFRQYFQEISRSHFAHRRYASGGCRRRSRCLGVIHLKDIVKGGMKERIAQLRAMGIRSVMITGDNPLTAAAIAAEAGVDDFLAQATPADKLDYIKREQPRADWLR